MRGTGSPWKGPNANGVKAGGKAGGGAWSLGKTCATARPPSRAANSSRRPTWRSRMQALDLRGEFRDHVEKITDDSIVRHLEDRCVFVLVDRHNHLGRPHASEVLDRAGNADRDVQRRTDRLAGLPHLVGVPPPPRAHHAAPPPAAPLPPESRPPS